MMKAFGESLRPRQWSKNLVLFAGVVFAQLATRPDCLLRAIAGFAVFCFASGAIYVYNDLIDAPQDRLHPYKRHRPIAAGRLSQKAAAILAAGLVLCCLAAAWSLGMAFLSTVCLFFLINGIYSRLLKRVVILDVVWIALSFVCRAIASVAVLLPVVPNVLLSNWLLLCTFFLSLFLGFSKRLNEMRHVEGGGGDTRESLTAYSTPMLTVLIGVSFALTAMAYALYTIWPETVEHFGTRKLVLTLPFVFYGLGRYLFLVFMEGRGESPHEILLNDSWLLAAVVGWLVTVLVIIGLR